jgi:four helix bundle protein
MENFSNDMSERFICFAVNILKLENHLCKTFSGRHVYDQVFRAGTSAAANFEEARSGESRADFIHKMQIVLKELRESHFWIKLVIAANMISTHEEYLNSLFKESKELTSITAKSIVTAKSKIGRSTSKTSLVRSL